MAVLGIDLGTQSVKVAVIDDDGAVVAAATRAYPVTSPEPGWAESDPQAWLDAVRDATDDVLLRSPAPPDAVGFSGQMHGVVLCDADANPLRPAITWADGRGAPQAERISAWGSLSAQPGSGEVTG